MIDSMETISTRVNENAQKRGDEANSKLLSFIHMHHSFFYKKIKKEYFSDRRLPFAIVEASERAQTRSRTDECNQAT